MFWDFQLPPKIFYGVETWRLARPLQDLEMLLTKPLLRCPGGVVWDHCHAEWPSHVSSSMPLLMEGGFHSKSHDTWPHSFFPLHRSVVLVPLQTNSPKAWCFHPHASQVGMVFLDATQHSFSSKTTSWVFTKSSILVSSDHMTFSQSSSGSSKCSLVNFRRAWTCTGLSRGTRLALQDLSPWRRSVLLMVAFVTLVPALCRSFTRSPRVVLGFLLTVLVIILTPRGEILRGAPDRGRLSVVLYVFHFLIIAPTVDFFTPSCLPIADSVFPAWCRSTILFMVSFDSSLVLAIVEFGVWLFEVVDRCLYTDNEFKQMPLNR